MISLDRFNGNYNILDDPSAICCVPDKGEVRNLNLFDMIVRKTLTKQVSCDCKSESDGRKFNSNQLWNLYLCQWLPKV